MKLSKLILLFLICTVFSVLASCAKGPETEPETEPQTEYAVVIPSEASETEVYAAQMLSEYLSALDGQQYPVISDERSFSGFRFCVGETSVYDTADIAGKPSESYMIAPFSKGLAIYGGGSRGTIYGVIRFLEEFCGYRYFTPESGMISVSGQMKLPEEKTEYTPFFEYRDTDWRSGWIPMYSLANKLNGAAHQSLSKEQGGGIAYLGNFSHTLSTDFCSAERYFKSHPEYFALHEGARVPDQLCLSNDSVYEIVLKEVFSLLRNGHDPEAELQIISLSQADNPVYCECDSCKALDSANGSHAGSVITFVNRIARAVKEKGYDNVKFDTLAYMHTRSAPSEVRPEDNVIVRLCTFECCFSHPMDDDSCPENAALMKDLEAWSKITGNLYIWDYTTNYAFTLGIFPDFQVLQKNLQCFYEHGVKGVYEEGNYYVHLCDTEFSDLRTYLIGRLLEDPYCDYEAEMLNFCNYYYGKGGEHIKTAIDQITADTKGHVSIYSPMSESFSIDENEAAEIDQLWSMAKDEAGSEDALAAINRSELSWRYVKAALGLREFKGTTEDNRDEREKLYNDLISHDVRMIDEWTGIEPDFTKYEQVPVEQWEYASRYLYLQFDPNSGTGGPENQWCGTGETWIPETIPVRKGYRFLGWAAQKNAVKAEYFPGGFITVSANMTLYAVWEKSSEQDDSGTEQGYVAPFGGYELYVAGVRVDSQNADMLQNLNGVTVRDGGHIRYDDSQRTLHLKDAVIIPSGNEGTAIGYHSQNNTALTIAVEGFCRLESRNHGDGSVMAMGSWGNLNIQLGQGAILEIKAVPCRDQYTNIGIYMDTGRTMTVSGPGALNVSSGEARKDGGSSIALYALGDIVFEKDCSVNITSDAVNAAGIGCRLEEGNLTLKDGSQIQIAGGKSAMSYGLHLVNDRTYSIQSKNWTGNMTIFGSVSAVRCETGNTRIETDAGTIYLTGYTEPQAHGSLLADKATYECGSLMKFRKLYFEGYGN